ncbi:MAG: tyrosine-protein kinase family protein, partial [Magnetococcales bacterium]|nr:tyrosine-protein kinase family protein [Magnetococcales bacterium]
MDDFDEDLGETRLAGGPSIRKKVVLDFQGLKAKGILTPDVGRSSVAEEFRIIKRPLLLNALGQGARKVENANLIMVTSAFPKEGKTFTAINLAMSLAAEVDNTVILVDGDVAKPSVSRILGFKAKMGLTDYLMEQVDHYHDILIRTNIPKLMLLPSGRLHHHATELLASENMRQLLHTMSLGGLGNERIIVVFDSPPLLVTTEARELARNMGQIVMVVEAERTPQMAVRDALEQLGNPEIVGLILNKVRYQGRG